MGLNATFETGLVLGLDVGTTSVGWALRRGLMFLDVGVEICPEDAANLEERRTNRRMRRTIRNRNRRLQRLRRVLNELGLLTPENNFYDPVALRLRAIAGEILTPTELHAALFHLLRRRGYTEVPWKSSLRDSGEDDESSTAQDTRDDDGKVKAAAHALEAEINEMGLDYPCQYLASKTKAGEEQRRRYWPRNLIEKEFRAICAAQRRTYPLLENNIDNILFGSAKKIERGGRAFHVYFTSREAENAGVFALRWPRFDNRSPGLDALKPYDEMGRPLHVVGRKKQAYREAQFELALMNFRVLDENTRRLRADLPRELVADLRTLWAKTKTHKLSESALGKAVSRFNAAHADAPISLVDGQPPLTPQSHQGRAKYSTPTLVAIRDTIEGGDRIDPPQPLLRRKGESPESAVARIIDEIPHPLVADRLCRITRILSDLIKRHGTPALVVVEAVRDIGLGKKKKSALVKRQKENREAREQARLDGARGRKEMLRYRLIKECAGYCVYCGEKSFSADNAADDAEIEHIVPYRRSFCDEWYNLTIACNACNKAKADRTPYEAFHGTDRWAGIVDRAGKFHGVKKDLLVSPEAETLVESRRSLAETSYIAKAARGLIVTLLGWTDDAGRDPSGTEGFHGYQSTNGSITANLRRFWGLNAALHSDLADSDLRLLKNRSDMRHHALDAMVIASTLPWAAVRPAEKGGWRSLSAAGDEDIKNPVGLTLVGAKEWMDRVNPSVREGAGHHAKHYKTTLLGRRMDESGEGFFIAREDLAGLKPGDLKKVHPAELGDYLKAAWERYVEEGGTCANKGALPEGFVVRLCFSHYQRWKDSGQGVFSWPRAVKIPIRKVRYRQMTSDEFVLPLKREQNGGPYVIREDFREVRIYRLDGKLKVVRVPHSRHDPAYLSHGAAEDGELILALRKGDVVHPKKAPAKGAPICPYRVITLAEKVAVLIPANMSRGHLKDAADAWSIGDQGVKPSWKNLVSSLEI